MENGRNLRILLSPHWTEITPKEIKIFLTMFWLADPDIGELATSLFRLSQKTKIPAQKIIPFLEKLKNRKLITFTLSQNYFLDSRFDIILDALSDLNLNRKITSDGISNIPFKYDQKNKTNGQNVKKQNNDIDINKINTNDYRSGKVKLKLKKNETKSTVKIPELFQDKEDISAEKIACIFKDEDNLALFKSYLNRYLKKIIQKAFHIVVNTPSDKIKKSKGAYFNFLVQKFGKENY